VQFNYYVNIKTEQNNDLGAHNRHMHCVSFA